ncbi:MAG TPA: hypothetical protein VGB70_04170 [Allosphingosinicella sp.]|jgi:hypothetical protein
MRHRLPLILLALALGAPAAAQEKPDQDDQAEIVVTGSRDVETQMRDFVGALTDTQGGELLSRFEREICPTAVGVSPAQKQAVIARMKVIAEAAGIAVGNARCTPNVLLVVTGDKAAFLDALAKKHPYYFGEMSPAEIRRLAREPGPASAWHIAGPKRTADGVELYENKDGVAVNRTTRSGSRLTAGSRPQFAAAAVVVEAKALDGLTTTQLADYAAMRAYSRTDPSKIPAAAPTILKVLETPMGEEVPITLTEWDLQFLRSLYTAPKNISAAAQRSQIRKGMKEGLEKGE